MRSQVRSLSPRPYLEEFLGVLLFLHLCANADYYCITYNSFKLFQPFSNFHKIYKSLSKCSQYAVNFIINSFSSILTAYKFIIANKTPGIAKKSTFYLNAKYNLSIGIIGVSLCCKI